MELYTIGVRIRYLRELNNYTREAFAEMVDISSKFLYEIETGKKGFSADTLHRISKALSVSCDYILTGKEQEGKCMDKIISIVELLDVKQRGKVEDILRIIYDLSTN